MEDPQEKPELTDLEKVDCCTMGEITGKMKTAADDAELRGKFHDDMAENSDAKWSESVEIVKAR